MGPEGLNEFARYFYPQLDKEALIIDDRANGGGNVSPMIIERLLRKPYRMTMSRVSTKTGTIPDATQYIRVPFFTNYDAKTGQWIVENHGVDPDILIDNDPIHEQSGVDQQLEKAIEVALEQLKDRKPLPGVPAPRTMKDLGVE